MTTIADDDARQRFVRELDRNFSVIASAGSGKTQAITDRIVEVAKDRQRALEWLPQLVVVTYTNRAADEMQQRTRRRRTFRKQRRNCVNGCGAGAKRTSSRLGRRAL